MTELYNCLLWEKTRVLAQDHNLEMSNRCPMNQLCTGEHCVFLSSIQQTADRVGNFYERLDKHKSIVKLAELREELKKMVSIEPIIGC